MEEIINPSDDDIPKDLDDTPIQKPLRHSRFAQQTLPGIRPIFTSFQAIIMLLSCTIVFLIIGLLLYFNQNGYNKVRIRYDNICQLISNPSDSFLPPNIESETPCNITIEIKKDLKGDLELQYELTNYYQNHRRYGYSKVDEQLAGQYVGFSDMSKCSPYRSEDEKRDESFWILPCGLFPNSTFNDTFNIDIPNALSFTDKGIAYDSEINDLYKPLSDQYKVGDKWLENSIFGENGKISEHFMVWMRQSALPHIVKTYKKCDNCEIKAGNYTLQVWSRYPTDSFEGEKYFTIAKITKLGTHNTYIGISFLICAGLSGVYGLVLVVAEIVSPRLMGFDPGQEDMET